MTEAERFKPAFLRPKRWFKQKDYKKTLRFSVFGLTTSNGRTLVLPWPPGTTAEMFAVMVKKRIVPFLRKSFPARETFQLLLDGEKVFHAPVAKAVFDSANIKSKLSDWPASSPDLNPQEHVWAWAEPRLRKLEQEKGTFETFKKQVLQAVGWDNQTNSAS